MNEKELILTSILDCDRTRLYADRPQLSADQQRKVEDILTRRRAGEPLQYLLRQWEFRGLSLKMAPGVFIPRPETELLVEKILERVEDRRAEPLRILEFGTGSGNIAVSLAAALPRAEIVSADVSEDALALARENAVRHGVEHRVTFLNRDMRDILALGRDSHPAFDVVVSNPPYVAVQDLTFLPEDVRREPVAALDGGEDGCDFYRAIIAKAAGLLKDGGLLALEIGEDQRPLLRETAARNPAWTGVCFEQDLNGRDRILLARKKHEL